MKRNNPWQEIRSSVSRYSINGILADRNHPLEFYWAKDISGNLLFVLSASSEIILTADIPKLYGIDISVGKQDRNYQLIFTLASKEDRDIFYTLCTDLMNSTRELYDDDHAVNTVLLRLEKWQHFLKNRRKPIDKKQLKGLVGELLFLKKYLLANYTAKDALRFWKAPLQSVHDFEFSNFAVEVKTKSSVNTVHISSYEQLFSELRYLLLYVATLNESTSSTSKAFNIYNLIDDIKSLLGNVIYEEKFENLLIQYGFFEREEYHDYWFLFVADEFYKVSEGFPRIRELPEGVEALTYRVNLEKCKDYRAEDKILQKAGLYHEWD